MEASKLDLAPYVDRLHHATVEQNTIPYSAIMALSDMLNQSDTKAQHILDAAFRWTDATSSWRKYKDDEGTAWVKRFSNYAFKAHDYKIPPELLSKIGDCIHVAAPSSKDYWFEIAKFSNWQAGAFEGGKETCWWGSYSEYRIGLPEHPDGYSVLFYKDEAQYKQHSRRLGIARCWMMNEPVGPIIFNAYQLTLSEIALALSKVFERKFTRVHLQNQAYINAGNMNNKQVEGDEYDGHKFGYVLQPLDVTSRLPNPYTLPDFSHKDDICHTCRKPMSKKRAFARIGGLSFCSESCTIQMAFICNNCGNWKLRGRDTPHAVSIQGRSEFVCDNCWAYHKTCHHCGDVLADTYNVWHTSRFYCAYCINRSIDVARCTSCGHITDKFVRIPLTASTLRLCPTCTNRVKETLNGH